MNYATAIRFAAIARVMDQYIGADGELIDRDVSRGEIVVMILELGNLGRTHTWQNAVMVWATMVQDMGNDLHWALCQGNVWVTVAA